MQVTLLHLNLIQPFSVLVCIKIRVTSMRTHLESYIHLWGFQYKKDMALLKQLQRWAMKMIGGMEHLFCEHKLRESGLYSLENRMLWGDLILAF